jgi:hypothetical protein
MHVSQTYQECDVAEAAMLIFLYSDVKCVIVVLSSSSESEDTDEDNNGRSTDSQLTPSRDSSIRNITFESLFPSMKQVYGMEIQHPKKSDILMYKRYGIH